MDDAFDPEKLRLSACAKALYSRPTMLRPGDIRSRQAYQQGKMLQNSGWHGLLPRHITPSDIDLVFDDSWHGRVIFCELTRKTNWCQLDRGQRLLHEGLVMTGSRRVFSVLLTHDVPINKEIDTVKDIRSFSVMFYLAGAVGICAPRAGTEWVPFVKRFYAGDPFNDYLSVGDFL